MFGNKILDFKDELLKDLNTLLSFESVDGEKNDECDNALNFILKRAEDFGLTGERTTDKSGHITLGDSGKLCGVLTLMLFLRETAGAFRRMRLPKRTADFTAEELQTTRVRLLLLSIV